LKAAGCEVVRAEKVSGTSRNGSEELKTILDFIRAGDVLVLKRLVGWRSFTTAIGALARKNSYGRSLTPPSSRRLATRLCTEEMLLDFADGRSRKLFAKLDEGRNLEGR
jgi:hypothetical protein